MTTVSKPNRNPASADVMAQKTIRRFKAWDLREVFVDEAVEVLISNAPTRVTRRDRSRSATTGNARWPRQPAGPGGQVPLSPLPRRLWCWPTDCQTGRNADGGDRPRTHASFPSRSCGASHSSQPVGGEFPIVLKTPLKNALLWVAKSRSPVPHQRSAR